jgi:hypothetical protein
MSSEHEAPPLWKRVVPPFEIGQYVRHIAGTFDAGVVTYLQFTPEDWFAEVSFAADSTYLLPVEAITEIQEASLGREYDLPFPFGALLKHRAKGELGILNGYKLYPSNLMARIAWSATQWDWRSLCELEEAPAPGSRRPEE